MTPTKCVPSASPSASPGGRTRALGEVRPPVPLPTGTDHSEAGPLEPPPVRPQPGTDHQINHLHQAAEVARITNDPDSTMTVLLGCPTCAWSARR